MDFLFLRNMSNLSKSIHNLKHKMSEKEYKQVFHQFIHLEKL